MDERGRRECERREGGETGPVRAGRQNSREHERVLAGRARRVRPRDQTPTCWSLAARATLRAGRLASLRHPVR